VSGKLELKELVETLLKKINVQNVNVEIVNSNGFSEVVKELQKINKNIEKLLKKD